MPEHIAKISNQLFDVISTIDQMRDHRSPLKAIKAFYEMACDCYGEANIVEYAVGIGQIQLLKGVR